MRSEEIKIPLEKYDLDKFLLGDETREPNWFYSIYKLSILSIGSSGSGKTTFLLNQLLNNVYDVSCIVFYLPNETIESGLYRSLFNKASKLFPNISFLISNLSKKEDTSIKINDKVIMINHFLTFKEIFELKKGFEKKYKNNKPFLLVFDDFISVFNKKEWIEFYEFLFNASRLNSYLYCCVQSIKEIPPLIRSNFTVVILFVNYLSITVVKTVLNNSIPLDLSKQNIDNLIMLIKHGENKHEPLILVGSTCERDKKIIYDNKYLIFD